MVDSAENHFEHSLLILVCGLFSPLCEEFTGGPQRRDVAIECDLCSAAAFGREVITHYSIPCHTDIV